MEGTVSGCRTGLLCIRLRNQHQLFLFIVQLVEINMSITLVTAGKELAVGRGKNGMRAGVEATAFHGIILMVVDVYHRTDGTVLVQPEQTHRAVVKNADHMIITILTLDSLGDHIETGVIGQQQILFCAVQSQETGAGSGRVDSAQLCQLAGLTTYRKCINKTAASLDEIGVFVELVGDIKNTLFRVDCGSVAGKGILLLSEKLHGTSGFIEANCANSGCSTMFFPTADV